MIGVSGIAHNISELATLQNALTNEKELLRVTLHSIGDAAITTGIDGKITTLNPVAADLTGWSQPVITPPGSDP